MRRKSELTGWPDQFELTDELALYAKSKNLDPLDEWEGFKLYHQAHGSRFASWSAAFQNWCRNAVKFKGGRAIGFTAAAIQPEAVRQAIRDNKLAAQETALLTDEQRRQAARKFHEIAASIGKKIP
jgi:hypothetical protein